MKSKERVQRAFAHDKPDRVPVDFSANSGIESSLKDYFGLAQTDYYGLLDCLGVDFRSATPVYRGPALHAPEPGTHTNEWGAQTRWVEHDTGGYWDYFGFALKNATEEIVDAFPMPNPDHFDYDEALERCKAFKDYYLLLGDPGISDCINSTGMVRGMEETLVDLAMGEGPGIRYMERKTKIQAEVVNRMLEKAKGLVDMVWIGEDLGTQTGPMISLDTYRELLRPRHMEVISQAKARGLPVMIHSCGSSSWAYEEFIAMGINAIDTLQPEVHMMEPSYLKSNYGSRLSFHGGISTAGPLAYGTVADVEKDVLEKLCIWMPGGGYAFSPTHQIQDNSPVENVVRMYELAHIHGRYL